MFRGIADVSLDDHGRIAVPTRFRDGLRQQSAGKLVITVDREELCLQVYAAQDWDAAEAALNAEPDDRLLARRRKLMLISHATDVDLDASGRMLIPPKLRSFAGLKKKVVVVGQRNRIGLWDHDTWEALVDAWREDARQLATSNDDTGER